MLKAGHNPDKKVFSYYREKENRLVTNKKVTDSLTYVDVLIKEHKYLTSFISQKYEDAVFLLHP